MAVLPGLVVLPGWVAVPLWLPLPLFWPGAGLDEPPPPPQAARALQTSRAVRLWGRRENGWRRTGCRRGERERPAGEWRSGEAGP